MKRYETIEFKQQDDLGLICLNRPEKHNAFNDVMISELTNCFEEVGKIESIRVLVLRGNGKSFCAGADLNYMKAIAQFGYEENFKDSKNLARLFETIYACPKPTLAVVHGAAFGGANGLLSACDLVIAEDDTTFAFSEVKIGITPATIGPYVLRRIGEFGGKELMMTGRVFNAGEAKKFGLVNRSVAKDKLEAVTDEYIRQFKTAAPKAVQATKALINQLINNQSENQMEYTADLIARLRADDEGQEGMAAFLEKRKPGWVK